MKRKARHLLCLIDSAGAVAAVGECDVEYLARPHGIFAIGLVEVATTKQQHRVRVLCLDVAKLFHHRSNLFLLFCHFSNYELRIMNIIQHPTA